jgi:SMC interacting uncharacterized protein involved in chromosome segregation
MSDEYKQLAGNVELLQGEVSRLKMAAGSVVMESERRLEQLKLQYDTVRATLSREQDGLHHVILDAVNLVVMHKVRWKRKKCWCAVDGFIFRTTHISLPPFFAHRRSTLRPS